MTYAVEADFRLTSGNRSGDFAINRTMDGACHLSSGGVSVSFSSERCTGPGPCLTVRDGTGVVYEGLRADIFDRWTNHRFLSTPHRVRNHNPGQDRYAIPFFFDASIDYPMACLPSCQSPDNPARYEPTTVMDYMLWFSNQYDHVREKDGSEVTAPGVPDL